MLFAAWLPRSQRSKVAKCLRVFFGKKILKSCGSAVNIEKNAYFTPDVSIGDRSSWVLIAKYMVRLRSETML